MSGGAMTRDEIRQVLERACANHDLVELKLRKILGFDDVIYGLPSGFALGYSEHPRIYAVVLRQGNTLAINMAFILSARVVSVGVPDAARP